MNHRALQRTLFRMQIDARFCDALLEGDATARRSTDLDEAEFELLRRADRCAIQADREDRRRLQVLGNILSEFPLTHAVSPIGFADPFLSSGEFHDAVRHDRPFALAFGTWVTRPGGAAPDGIVGAFARLEQAMAELRRADPHGGATAIPEGHVRLAPLVRLLDLPSGTVDHAAAVRFCLDGGRQPPRRPAAMTSGSVETAMVVAEPRKPGTSERSSTRPIRSEPLVPAVARLLRLALLPLGPAERADIAIEHDADPVDLEGFVDTLVVEGVLLRGGPAA